MSGATGMVGNMGGGVGGVMDRLKHETADLHREAERSEFQQRLLRGGLTREGYAAWLGQMLLVHTALEASLGTVCWAHKDIAGVVEDWQLDEPNLLADLKTLGSEPPHVPALPATARVASEIEAQPSRGREGALSLLGMHYVLEGSHNGGRFIAKGVRRSFGFAGAEGTRYLDPHGEQQMRRWGEFKAAMTAAGFPDAEVDVLVAGAKRMFGAVSEIGGDLVKFIDG